MSKTDRYQKQLLELAKQAGNDSCADCGARNPRWASWDQGVFICVSCASLHRKLGTHISKVKSLTLDTWSKDQVEHMKARGNKRVNGELNPDDVPPPTTIDVTERNSQLERYIRAKYEHKQLARAPTTSQTVPSAEGPPRSASPLPLPTRPRAESSVANSPDSIKQVRFSGAAVDIDEEQPRAPSRSRSPSKSILRPSVSAPASASASASGTSTPVETLPPIVLNAQPVTALPAGKASTNPFLTIQQPLKPNHTGVQGSLSSMRQMHDALPPPPRQLSLPPMSSPSTLSSASPMASPLPSPGPGSTATSSWASPTTRSGGFMPTSSFGQQLAAELSQPAANANGHVSPAAQPRDIDPYAALGAFDSDNSSPFALPQQQHQQQPVQPQRTGYNPFLAMQQQQPSSSSSYQHSQYPQPQRAMSMPLPAQSHYTATGHQEQAAAAMMMMMQHQYPIMTGQSFGYAQQHQQQQQPLQTNPFLRMQQQHQQYSSYGNGNGYPSYQ